MLLTLTDTSFKFVHVNGRSLHTVDRWMGVEEGGNVLQCKWGGEIVRGGTGNSPEEYMFGGVGLCPGVMSDSRQR